MMNWILLTRNLFQINEESLKDSTLKQSNEIGFENPQRIQQSCFNFKELKSNQNWIWKSCKNLAKFQSKLAKRDFKILQKNSPKLDLKIDQNLKKNVLYKKHQPQLD